MTEGWAQVDAFKARAVNGALEKAQLLRFDRARRARNLVWRHFRRLPLELGEPVVRAWMDDLPQVVRKALGTSPRGTTVMMEAAPIVDDGAVLVASDWLLEHGFTMRMAGEKPPEPPIAWRLMTSREVELASGLGRSRIGSGFDKRFVRDLRDEAASPAPRISPRQAVLLEKLAYRYRRQLVALGIEAPPAPAEVAHGG